MIQSDERFSFTVCHDDEDGETLDAGTKVTNRPDLKVDGYTKTSGETMK